MKRLPLLFVLFSFHCLFSQNQLKPIVDEILSDSNFKNAVVGIVVYDTKTGEKLFANSEKTSIATASTTKLFSTAAALSIIPNKKIETRFYMDGEVHDGVLYGNIWIRGGGDPTLGSRYTTNDRTTRNFLNDWVDSIRSLGITAITGAIIGDASEFGYKGCPDGWSWSDLGNAYGAYPSGLAVFDNVLNFRINTGSVGKVVSVDSIYPYVPNLKFHNYITSADVNGDNSSIYGAPFQNERIGIGTLQRNTSIRIRSSLPNPEFQTAYEFRKRLFEAGINLPDSILTARDLLFSNNLDTKRYEKYKLLFSHSKSSVFEIAKQTNLHSVNMFAEQLVCLLGYFKNGDGSHENGLTQLQNFWKNAINAEGLHLRDGSGLSRSNAINAEHLVFLLNYMYKNQAYNSFFETLPVTGKSGTLKELCKNQAAHGKIHAKSGTMQRIKSYAGYAFTSSGRQLSFAIILNNYNCSTAYATNKIQKFMNVLVTLP